MTFIQITAAVLLANFLTIFALYTAWRANRDDGWLTILMGIGAGLAIAAVGWAARP